MKLRSIAFAGLLAASACAAAQDQDAEADAITGVWETESGGYVQIYDAGDTYAGKVVGSRSGEARYDKENPDPEKQGRRLLGTTPLKGLQYEGDNTWGGGEIYDPNSGKTYSAKATLLSPTELEVRGYMGISLLGKSQIWTPVPPDAPNLEQDLLEGAAGASAAQGGQTSSGSTESAQ